MSSRLGWARAEGQKAIEGCRFVASGGLVEIVSNRQLNGRDRLGMQQACYRAFDAFLPDNAGLKVTDEAEILARLDAIEGCGQVRLKLKRAPRAVVYDASTGRAHLQNLRRKAAASASWFETTRARLSEVSLNLPSRESRVTCLSDAVIVDLLVPSDLETDLMARLEPAVAAANDLSGQLTISGLWAPFAFAETRESAHA